MSYIFKDKLVEFWRLFNLFFVSVSQIYWIFLLIFSLTITSIILPINYSAKSGEKSTEIRGVWLTNIDSDVLFEKQTLSNAIETLAQLNFNTIYPTVWNWGYTLYPSQIAKGIIGKSLDPTPGLQGRDIMQEMIDQGHNKNLAVIPWFEFGFMAPADSELAKRHPQWLTQRRDGSKIWLEGNIHQRVWLNPLHPEVQKFITDLIVEIVSNYDIDGIQLDDHFGIPYDFGYDDFTVKLYQKEHKGKLPPKLSQWLEPNKSCIANNRQWTEWTNWRSQKITNYVKDLFKAIKKRNPQVIVSLSPNPQTFSLNCYLLDWEKWERMGLVEELIVQVYRNNTNDFTRELSQPSIQKAKVHIPTAIGILSGLKGRPIPFNQIQKQVEIVRNQKFAGASFFFYESLWNLAEESPEKRQSSFKSIFTYPVMRPSISVISHW